MLILSSLLLVSGAIAVFALNVILSDQGRLVVGYQDMVRGGVPYVLLVPLTLGLVLSLFGFVRRRSRFRGAVAVLEGAILAFFVFLFTGMTALPDHRLTVAVGDAFPGYSLPDQNGVIRAVAAHERRAPAIYIFYRGDW